MSRFFKFYTLCLCLLCSSQSFAADVRYVSDSLTIPMRSGTTTNHKILKFLDSGMAVKVLSESPDKSYLQVTLVEDETRTGWVEARLLMSEPSAREQLKKLRISTQSVREKQSVLRKQLASEKQINADLLDIQKQLEQKVEDLKSTLQRFRTTSAEPIRLAEENDKLKQALSIEKQKNTSLEEQNAFLADQNIKQWFMIGAAVSLGSLILGLLITRINWRKKDSWGSL